MPASAPYAADELDKASELLRLAIPLLTRHGIPPSPIHYRLAYDYVAGRSEELRRRLDERLQGAEAPSAEQLWELYRQFFLPDFEALENMRQELRRLVLRIQRDFESSGDHLSDYARTLHRFADILDASTAPGAVAAETRKVLEETQSVEQQQRHFESGMAVVMSEVDTLRRELELVKKESTTDALTGIANRKAFDTALAAALVAARDDRRPFSLLLLDIDRFKSFNDRYGHLVGDKVLRFVAVTLQHSLKGRDLVARFGGEEFAVILPNTAMIGAEAVAQQIRRAISAGELRVGEGAPQYGQITISIGVAQARWNESASELLERADKALYRAKERGRDRVEKAR